MKYYLKLKYAYITLIFICLLPDKFVFGQSDHYWSTNLNEESSMLAGAVVGGGASVGSIYYNPSLISTSRKSLFSFNASLFSVELYTLYNALGNGISLRQSRFKVQPRFISYVFTLEEIPQLSFQAVVFSKANSKIDFSNTVSLEEDIIRSLPGKERYFANFKYFNNYSETWFGIGASFTTKNGLSFGISMFGTIKSQKYHYNVDVSAGPLTDTINTGTSVIPYYSASTTNYDYLTFNNYRLIWKIGASYRIGAINFGLNITTPSLSVYSDYKSVTGKESQRNITNPDGSGMLPNYDIDDEQVKKDINVNSKDPFSIALGANYTDPSVKNYYYTTIEFFSGIKPYKMLTAKVNTDITTGNIFDLLPNKDWLSYVSGANRVFNLAFAYKRVLSKSFLLLSGFKTDFSNKKGLNYKNYKDYKRIYSMNSNLYHLTGGILGNYKGNRFFAGLQYSFGSTYNSKQIANFSDPVEYNTDENIPLQGTRQYIMDTKFNGISLFFGATFNFGQEVSTK
jgi:hypothetical protein